MNTEDNFFDKQVAGKGDIELETKTADVKEDITKNPLYDPILKQVIKADWNKQEVAKCQKLIKSEQSHGQWLKQGLCVVLLILLILMNLCMGTS